MKRFVEGWPFPVRPVARGLIWCAFSVLVACSQPQSDGVSSTLEGPTNPGDGYSLLRVADNEHTIEHIAVSGDYLFFTMSWHGVYAMPKYGGDVIAIDADSNAEELGLVASPSDVVWVKARFGPNDTPNEQLRRRGPSTAPITNLKQGNLQTIITSSAKNLQLGATQAFMMGEGFIEATPLEGGASTRVAFPWNSVDRTTTGMVSFQADDQDVYVVSCPYAAPCDNGCGNSCTLSRGDPATGQSAALAALAAGVYAIALDSEALYLTDGTRLWRRSRVDGTEVDLFSAEAQGLSVSAPVVADADHLYVVGYPLPGSGVSPTLSVLAIPKTPGTPALIGNDSRLSTGIWELAVDDQFVFALASFTGGDTGNQVLAFPKTPTE